MLFQILPAKEQDHEELDKPSENFAAITKKLALRCCCFSAFSCLSSLITSLCLISNSFPWSYLVSPWSDTDIDVHLRILFKITHENLSGIVGGASKGFHFHDQRGDLEAASSE